MADKKVDVIIKVRLEGPGFFTSGAKAADPETALKAAMQDAMGALNEAFNSSVIAEIDLQADGRIYRGRGKGSAHESATSAIEEAMAAFEAGIDSKKQGSIKKILTFG